MKALSINNFNFDFKVLNVEQTKDVKYYLLKNTAEIQDSSPTFYQVVKESNVYREPFTGRMIRFDDIERTFKKQEYKANGGRGVKIVETEVPYIHNLNDYAYCNEKEAKQVFGDEYEMIVVKEAGNPNNKLFCFYNKKETIKKSEESSSKKVKSK